MATHPVPSTDREPVTLPKNQPIWKQVRQSRIFKMFKKFVVLPLIGVLLTGMIIGRVANAFFGPNCYYVYVVGDENDKSVKEMMDATAASPNFNTLQDVPVKVETKDDSGDPQQAEMTAKQLAKRPDVLMVVGHVFSTVTKRALPQYMEADPPVPLILTTETNPTLTPAPGPGDPALPVFRLFPTDNNQASVAAKFFAEKHAKSVWVVEDSDNPAYSQYLAHAFLSAVYDEQPELKVILWSNNLNLPPYSVDKLGIDWVFFAGDWRNALVLVRQLQALPSSPGTVKPKILLSDASADQSLLDYGGTDVEGVYLLHPLQAEVFMNSGYKAVGEEARDLTSDLINRAHEDFDELAMHEAPLSYRMRRWLGLHRISDARRAVARAMDLALSPVGNSVFLSGDSTIKMGIDANSHLVVRKEVNFHIWQVQHKKFVTLELTAEGRQMPR